MAEQKDDGEDDDILMDTLAHLEDLLMDEVTLGGDEDEDECWNASNSKSGESMRSELREFEDRAAESFHDMLAKERPSEGKTSDDTAAARAPGEFSLVHTDLHRQFAALVERRVEGFLRERGSSARDLVALISRAEERSGRGGDYHASARLSWVLDASREIITLLKEVDDFELWATNMQRKAENQRAAASASSYQPSHK